MLDSDILTTPFYYYQAFLIEEKFGFNTDKKNILVRQTKRLVDYNFNYKRSFSNCYLVLSTNR
jgi:hypothetical protein